MAVIMDSVDGWESHRIAFAKAGGNEHQADEQCSQIMKMLPDTLSFDMLSTADDYTNPEELIGCLGLKSTFLRERGAKELRAVEAAPEPPPHP